MRSWWRPRGALVVGLFAVTAGLPACAGSGSVDAGPATTATAPTTTAVSTTTTPTPTDPPGTHRFVAYWMRDCADPEHAVEVSACRIAGGEARLTTDADYATAAIHALLDGPNDVERLNGLSTNIRRSTTVSSVRVEGDTATVAFNRYFETAKTRPQTAQVVFTLTQFPEIKKVRITVDGTSNGAVGAGDLTRENVDEFTPSVFLEGPTFNATVPTSFRISGTASTPTATFAYRVLGPGDTELTKGTAKVIAQPSTRGAFVEPVKLPATATGPVVLVTTAGDAEVRTPLTIA